MAVVIHMAKIISTAVTAGWVQDEQLSKLTEIRGA